MKYLNKLRLQAGLPIDATIEVTEKKQITEARDAPRLRGDMANKDKRSLSGQVRGIKRAMDHIRQAIATLDKIPATDYSGEIPHFIAELENLVDGDEVGGMSGYLDKIGTEHDDFGKEPEPEMDEPGMDDAEIDVDVEISDDPEMTAVDDEPEMGPDEEVMPEAEDDEFFKNLSVSEKQQLRSAITTLRMLSDGSMIKEAMTRVAKVANKTLEEAAHYYGVNYDGWETSERPVNVSNGSANDEQVMDTMPDPKTEGPEQTRTMDQQDNSPQDKSGDDLSNKINIPKYVTKGLKDAISDFRKEEKAEQRRNKGYAKEAEYMYRDSANAFEELLELMSGSLYDFKKAQIKATSLMGPMLHKIPNKVWKFITDGGEQQSLKSYMTDVPKTYPITGPRNTLK